MLGIVIFLRKTRLKEALIFHSRHSLNLTLAWIVIANQLRNLTPIFIFTNLRFSILLNPLKIPQATKVQPYSIIDMRHLNFLSNIIWLFLICLANNEVQIFIEPASRNRLFWVEFL